jgi:tetratricopeptide (TPR) repeat protein
LNARRGFLNAVFVSVFASLACAASAQLYQVGPSTSQSSQTQSGRSQSATPALGWGSNIQNARLGRAAELALQHRDYAQAFDDAQRAAHAAPNDPQLWFLLGYAARLDGNLWASVDAYTHGLHLDPAQLDGQSGLAQVYSLMGQTGVAEKILKQVVASNPSRRDDLMLLGDLSMRQKDFTSAVDWIGRAEKIRPDARAEVLLAISYQQLKQDSLASQYLAMAERRAPDNVDVLRTTAGFYRDIGKYSDAIAALRSIHNPSPDVQAELAYTYQLDGKYADSARLYITAANDEPRNLTLQLSAAQAEVAVGSIPGATPFLDRVQTLSANDYRLHAIKGEIAKLQERDQDAVREYTAALATLPSQSPEGPLYGIQLHMDLVSLDRTLENDSEAQQQLAIAEAEIDKVNGSGPDREQFLRLRSLIRLNAGNLDGALDDIHQALAIDSLNRDNLQLDGDVLMKLGHTGEAIAVYQKILSKEPDNTLALTSLGYALRSAGQEEEAEKCFERLARADPSSYVPYLALGDLYTSTGKYSKAQEAYTVGYSRAPQNALIVAGGINAGIESHNLPLAGEWMSRVVESMQAEPKVLREKERYLTFEGEYAKSAQVGRQAIRVLPHDRDVVVYLGYDLLHLGDYNDLLHLTSSYWNVLPREPDIPLLAGYVHKHDGMKEQALKDFTEAARRDPNAVTAYVNCGYMLNDLHQPRAAAAAFESALSREPNDGEAHLGLAYSELDLRQPRAALREAELAEKTGGNAHDLHIIRATAYGRVGLLTRAAGEYRAALKLTPNDSSLHLGLGSTLFAERQYQDAIQELELADKLSPGNGRVYAMLARSYANLHDRNQTLRYVQLAEQHIPPATAAIASANSGENEILISAGDALSTLGDVTAAMDLFRRALTEPGSDRVGVRLAIAGIMVQQGRTDDAQRQIALAWMEAEAGDTAPPDGGQYIAAADLFRAMHDYPLSQTYLERAKLAGAPDADVRIGMANNFLALGDTVKAQAELAAVSDPGNSEQNYQYLLAKANVLRQEQKNAQALTAFAQAANAAGDDESAVQGMIETGGDEGLRITPDFSALSDLAVAPIFEDTTVYVLDSKLDASFAVPVTDTALLPPPRSSLQTMWTDAFHLHLGNLPPASGFYQLRNARGLISVPSTNSVINRDTTDSVFDFALNPSIHLGDNVLTFNSGVQGTVRRDSRDPVDMNQNLFRVYTYMNTSSFFNAVSVNGYALRESGPFTESNLNSRELAAAVNFRVGAPWGRTALITGWGADDQVFRLIHTEDYYSSSYIGFEHRFSDRLNLNALAEDLRAWRIFGNRWGIAQDLRPAGSVDFIPKRNWDVKFSSAYSSTRGFHVYDATQNGFSVSYARAFRHVFHDQSEPVPVQYPIRFSAGLQDESFFNFTGAQNQQLRPYVEISIF